MFNHRRHINYLMLLKVTGWLLMIESFFMTVPAAVAYAYDEPLWWREALVALGTFAVGCGMQCIRTRDTRMGRREGFLLTATVWVWFSLFGMWPFILCGGYGVTDAFFEAMSGFTTTGSSVIDGHGVALKSFDIWRALMQWIGGMGIILFTLAVIPMLNSSGGMQMFNAEVTGITHDKVRPRISSTAKALWGTYIVLTLTVIGILWAGPMDLFNSVCYGFGTMSTGGFAPPGFEPQTFGSNYVYIVLTIFMFLGGVNFGLLFQTACGRPLTLLRNEVFRVFLGAIIVLTAIFGLTALWHFGTGAPIEEYTVYPLFQVVSVITSAGYYDGHSIAYSPLLVGLTMAMVFSGGCAGSTSGGAKIDRILYVFKHLYNEIARCVRPNAVLSVRINDRVISPTLVDKVTAFLCLYMVLILGVGLALSAMGINLEDAMFSALTCISNAGLTHEMTGYGADISLYPAAAKWLLAWLMLTGRLEIFTVLILFTKSFWVK